MPSFLQYVTNRKPHIIAGRHVSYTTASIYLAIYHDSSISASIFTHSQYNTNARRRRKIRHHKILFSSRFQSIVYYLYHSTSFFSFRDASIDYKTEILVSAWQSFHFLYLSSLALLAGCKRYFSMVEISRSLVLAKKHSLLFPIFLSSNA